MMMNRVSVGLALALMLATAGCSNMNSTEQSMVSGGAIGAGTGAVVGALTGGLGIATGAAIGAAVGAGAGYVVDQTR